MQQNIDIILYFMYDNGLNSSNFKGNNTTNIQIFYVLRF